MHHGFWNFSPVCFTSSRAYFCEYPGLFTVAPSPYLVRVNCPFSSGLSLRPQGFPCRSLSAKVPPVRKIHRKPSQLLPTADRRSLQINIQSVQSFHGLVDLICRSRIHVLLSGPKLNTLHGPLDHDVLLLVLFGILYRQARLPWQQGEKPGTETVESQSPEGKLIYEKYNQ